MSLYLVFIISLLGALGILLYKVYAIRQGKAPVFDETHAPAFDVHLDVSALKEESVNTIKKAGHQGVMSAIKVWIVSGYVIRKRLRKSFPKLYKKLYPPKKVEGTQTTNTSVFLDTVADYKKKAKKLKQKIREFEKEEVKESIIQEDQIPE